MDPAPPPPAPKKQRAPKEKKLKPPKDTKPTFRREVGIFVLSFD